MAATLTEIFKEDERDKAEAWPRTLLQSEHVAKILSSKIDRTPIGKWIVTVRAEMVSGYDLEEQNAGQKSKDKPSEERPGRIIYEP